LRRDLPASPSVILWSLGSNLSRDDVSRLYDCLGLFRASSKTSPNDISGKNRFLVWVADAEGQACLNSSKALFEIMLSF